MKKYKIKIQSIKSLGIQDVYDLEIPKTHNFILSNGAVAHNCAHAVSYSALSYLTAYLKYYYPTEFMCAILNSEDPNSDKVLEYKQVAKELGIEILPPSINDSDLNYKVLADKKIVTGLLAIKGIGEAAINYILEHRPYSSFPEFIRKSIGSKGNRSPISKTIIENLAKAGCFDVLGISRKNALEHWEDIKSKIVAAAKKAVKNNITLDLTDIVYDIDDSEEFSKKEILQNEMSVLGHYVSGSYNDIYGNFFRNSPDVIKLDDVKNLKANTSVKVEAVVKVKIKELTIQKGKSRGRKFAKYLLEDLNGKTAELTLWPEHYEKFGKFLNDGLPIRAICDVNEYNEAKSLILRKIEDISGYIVNGVVVNNK